MAVKQNDPVSVNGNITPITRRPIQSVKADEWHKMSVNELYDQQSIIHGRMVIANQMGNPALLQQLEFGVAQLQAYIDNKTQTEDEQ